jgi:hypothetical protein
VPQLKILPQILICSILSETRIRGHGRLMFSKTCLTNKANHYFSPHKSASANRAREILDSLRLSPPTVAPGQTPGALRFVSLALHILPQKGGRHRRNVSARKASEPALHPETYFSKALLHALRNRARIMQHTASLDVLAEPNYYSKLLQTSSTRVFASHFLRLDELQSTGRNCLQSLNFSFSGDSVVKIFACADESRFSATKFVNENRRELQN